MLDIGTVIAGKYRVVRQLGKGAMGAVYHVEHTTIARAFAIKVLHARFVENTDAVARFEREARAAGSIGHENVVDVFDFGDHAGQPFIVMEMLRGETVADRLNRVPAFVPREACRIAGQMLSALATVHAKGVIHRDLKPENVFLMTRNGAPDVVKLVDFGISKIHSVAGEGRSLTREGTLLGTPQYMAPEQWDERVDVDHRVDLWACGVTLYEMLTGGLPYEGTNEAEFFNEVVRGSSVPRPPSDVARESTIPHALDAAVLRAVRRARDERFRTAREFLEAIRPFGAENIPVTDEPPSRRPTGAIPLARARVSINATPTMDVSEVAGAGLSAAGTRSTSPHVITEDAPPIEIPRLRRSRAAVVSVALVLMFGIVAARMVPRSIRTPTPLPSRAIAATSPRVAPAPVAPATIAAATPSPAAVPAPPPAIAVVAAETHEHSTPMRAPAIVPHRTPHASQAADDEGESAMAIPTQISWIPTSQQPADHAGSADERAPGH